MSEHEPATEAPAQLEVDWATEPPPVYFNFASISGRPEDFAIVLCSLSPSGKVDENGKLPGRIMVSARTNPSTFFQLLSAMVTVWNNWADHVGMKGTPRFKQIQGSQEAEVKE